jgi:hypothetical protein
VLPFYAVRVTDRLSRRALNRATLARQHLLQRVSMPALDMIEQLGGMQSQLPLAPYVGLWSRIDGFTPAELSGLTERRQVVRLHLMRNTVHLASAADALAWRPLFDSLLAAQFSSRFGRGVETVDREQLLDRARALLTAEPMTRARLGRRLAETWPDADPGALAYAASHLVALCQVPPRGVWGRTGPAAWTPVESWLGRPLQPTTVDELVRRYLGAFGPASVADAQAWSGLTRLAEVVERMPLRAFTAESGATVYDLPDAPRPDEATPAPARLLPEYDNLLLSHRDRTRFNPAGRPVPLPPGNGATGGTFLIDGVWSGTWATRDGEVELTPFGRLSRADKDQLETEAGLWRAAQFGAVGGG